ncbi:MAG: hypothetical protein ABI566_05495 [Pseudolysinimonas sp.]
MNVRNLAVIPIVLAAALALSSCSESPDPAPSETEQSTPTPTPTSAEAVEQAFAMPTDCTGLLPAGRLQAFTDQGLVLLGGPGGLSPHYYADLTPEERAGGISCIWGDEAVIESTVTISAAPLTASTRSTVVDDLIAQGLNEAVLDDGISYAQLGDENSAPAVLNIVRDDSWISVIEALGGETRFNEAVQLADEAATQTYGP